MNLIIFFTLILVCSSSLHADLKILFTSAITNNQYYELRKQQYINSFNILAGYGYPNVYVVEAIAKGPTFLEDYSTNVFYSTVNDTKIPNTGVNEARTSLEAINHFNFDDEDMILKVTGRYLFLSDDFIRFVEQHLNDYDAFVKIRPNTPQHCFIEQGGLYTVCFAVKCKYLREMYQKMPYTKMIQQGRHIEWEFDDYIQKKIKRDNLRVCYVETFNLEAQLRGSTSMPNVGDITVIL